MIFFGFVSSVICLLEKPEPFVVKFLTQDDATPHFPMLTLHNTSFTGCGQPGQDAVVILQKPDGICAVGTFNANANSRSDCLDCFCFGITDECTSTELFLNKVRPIF